MIVFENDGALDIRAIKTFGVNSKADKESAIGYFGTGLKYAIAILLRTGHKISIMTNGVNLEFGVNSSRIRNDDFDIVTMNGEELGFTTELGKDWETWMAFREIYSNMLDEKGKAYEAAVVDPKEGKTYVLVEGAEIARCYHECDHYFLDINKFAALQTHKEVDIYRKAHDNSSGYIFYKGVRVMSSRLPALFDYNHHLGLTLTEDRTIKDTWSTLWHVSAAVTSSRNKQFIVDMVMADPNMYEGGINFKMNNTGNLEFFLDVVGDLRKKYKDSRINPTAIKLHKELRKVKEILPAISCYLNTVQQAQLDKAVSFCKNTLELDVDDYQLIICKDLGSPNDFGRANIPEGIMYISKQAFERGTKCVATAILEEYTHCKHEVADETVAQKWVYLNQIMSLGERLDGDPL